MKFLVIGLGSMGKRRIRNLQALGQNDIAGMDPREDRRLETEERYRVPVFADFEAAMETCEPDVLIISTPPQLHMRYAFYAFEHDLPCFIEASVVDAEKILELHDLVEKSDLPVLPSCTMKYNFGPAKIKELVAAGVIGRPLNINYQTGQYLPDWHPWERIEDFYVSSTETGGCREIVPFELTWLCDVFGPATALSCIKTKLTDINAPIDDVYHCLLRFPNSVLANMTVEVVSRPRATRELRILGSEGLIVFSADENCVRFINADMEDWQRFDIAGGTVEKDYINPEEPYIAEMRDFVEAVTRRDKTLFPNSLLDDYHILQTLYRLEALSEDSG